MYISACSSGSTLSFSRTSYIALLSMGSPPMTKPTATVKQLASVRVNSYLWGLAVLEGDSAILSWSSDVLKYLWN